MIFIHAVAATITYLSKSPSANDTDCLEVISSKPVLP